MEALQGKGLSRQIAILIAIAVFTSLVVANLSGSGQVVNATHSPADKVIASGGKTQEVPAATTEGKGTAANTILAGKLRTSTPSDLILSVTLECSIITDLTVPGTTTKNATSSGSAEGLIRVWIVIDDTYIVPINDMTGTTQGHAVGDDSDKVTFCNREHKVTIRDTEDPADGIDEQKHYLRTKNANGFNWLALNLGNGIHTIEVRADFTAPAATNTSGTSSGFVGNRTLVVEPAKLANDAKI